MIDLGSSKADQFRRQYTAGSRVRSGADIEHGFAGRNRADERSSGSTRYGNISQKVFRLAPTAELADHVNYRSEREKNYG